MKTPRRTMCRDAIVSAGVGYCMSQMVRVSTRATPSLGPINGGVFSVIGLAVQVTANIIEFPPPPSD